jgi:hypothetical protein
LVAPPTAKGETFLCPACNAPFSADQAIREVVPIRPVEKGTEEGPGEAPGTLPVGPPPVRRRSIGPPLWTYLVAAGLLTLALVVGYLLLSGGFRGQRSSDGKSGFAEEEWQVFSPAGGHCRVEVPGQPVRWFEAEAQFTDREVFNRKVYKLDREDRDRLFLLTWFDLPNTSLAVFSFEERCRAMQDRQARTLINSRVVRKEDIRLGEWKGLEWEIQDNDGTRLSRAYLVPGQTISRFYYASIYGPHVRPGLGAAARFFDSLEIDGPDPGR